MCFEIDRGANAQRDHRFGPSRPTNSRMVDKHISELRISHFRSFGHEITISFRPGLNILCGANGSGKSNALYAALFALCQETSILRVRTFSELTNRARQGPCAVRLILSADMQERLVLMAHVKEQDSSRSFKLNGTQRAKNGFASAIDLQLHHYYVHSKFTPNTCDRHIIYKHM